MTTPTNRDCERILQDAHKAAIAAVIKVLQRSAIDELDGTTSVILDDSRSRFARYLKNKGVGERNRAGGWRLPILPESALDEAAAGAFISVLEAAGISAAELERSIENVSGRHPRRPQGRRRSREARTDC